MFVEGEIPIDCAWRMVVLTPKENGGFCGIGLVEVIWKEILGVANCPIGAEVDFHYTLHGFRSGRLMGTVSPES